MPQLEKKVIRKYEQALMYLEYLTGTSWSSLILSNISSLRQKHIKIKKNKPKPTYWHLFFSPGETAELLYEELEPPGSRIRRPVNAEPAFPLMHKQGKTQLLGPTRNAQLPSPTRRHSWLKKVLFLVKHTNLVWSHWKKWTLWCHFFFFFLSSSSFRTITTPI